jgi:hypothetical protein
MALVVALAGCSSVSLNSSPQTTGSVGGRAPTFRDRVTNLFSTPPAQNVQGQESAATKRDADDECPGVEIRPGTSTLQYSARGAEPTAVNLQYQVSIARTARECAISGRTMTMKVGVQGRVILGPAGSPGQINVPLRYALVQEGVEPKTIWTNLRKFPVTVAPDQSNVTFLDIEEGISFPLPGRADLVAYVVYVGFDQVAAQEKPAPRRRRSR